MALLRSKTTTTALSLILILAIATSITVLPAVRAIEYPTYLLINAAPNPVGVGQPLYVNAFLSKPHPSSGMGTSPSDTNRTYVAIRIEVVQPDGTKETLGPRNADSTGGVWFTYVPAKTGNYTFQAFYPGQNLTLAPYAGDYLKPSVSEIIKVVVQNEPIREYSSPPLPSEYWSRPIYSTNHYWAQELGSHWWGLFAPSFTDTGGYNAEGNVQPYGKAPNTAHILWTRSTAFGGLPGGTIPSDQEGQFTSTSILIRHFEPIILNGVLYYQEYPSASSPSGLDYPNRWIAIDLRTGEVIWHRNRGITNAETLKWGQIQKFHSMQEFGCWAALWATGSGSMMYLYDAFTGAHMANVTNAVSGNGLVSTLDIGGSYEYAGGILRWYVSGGNLTFWNSTKLFSNRPSGQQNWTSGIQWTFNMTAQYPAGTPTSIAVISFSKNASNVLLLRSAPTLIAQTSAGYQVTAGIDPLTGSLLWGPLNQTIPQYQDVSLIDGDDGVYVLHNKDTAEAYGYSLENGQLLWGPIKLPHNAWSYISRGAEIAYGNVYIWDYGGYVHALDLKTGEIKWTFHRGSAGYDNPLGVYPIWHFGSHSVADGKLFLSEGRMYDPPLSPNMRRLCINATTGELVWSILSFSGRAPGVIADGMLVQWNSYDNQIYTFGKGQTATTVAIQDDVVTHGSKVLVKGIVTDESPGTKHPDRVARFPHGVPAVSDESMSAWMEYVYMQQPKPTDVKGVEVVIEVFDPNSNYYEVARTTSDASGFYSATFEPPVPGKYTVIAKFAGSESYWGSYAETAIFVEDAPQPTPEPTPTPASVADLYFLPVSVGMIIAIVVIGLVIILMLRKR